MSLFLVMKNSVEKQENAADTEQKDIHNNAEDKRMQNVKSRSIKKAVYEVASCFAEDKIKQEINHQKYGV